MSYASQTPVQDHEFKAAVRPALDIFAQVPDTLEIFAEESGEYSVLDHESGKSHHFETRQELIMFILEFAPIGLFVRK